LQEYVLVDSVNLIFTVIRSQ